jgi:hypothetical protein
LVSLTIAEFEAATNVWAEGHEVGLLSA